MKSIGKRIIKIILGIFIILFSWIIINSFLREEEVIFKYNSIVLVVTSLLCILLLVGIYKFIIPKILKYKWLPYILFFLFGVITIYIAYDLRLNPSWDMGRVYNIALEYVNTNSTTDIYLYEYENNIAITVVFIILFKVFSFFHVTDYIIVATIFNAIIVISTVICIYYVIKELYGKKKALMGLIICMCTTPLYLYATIYYTDTLSMFCTILLLLLYLKIKNNKNKKIKLILQILFGIILLISMKLKITSIFIVISILVTEILNGNIKIVLNNFKIAIPICILFCIIYSLVINKIFVPDKNKINDCKMPVEYWLLIGSIGNGGFNQEEYEYIKSYPTYQERKKAGLCKLKENIEEYNIITFTEHINKKLKFAWGDGTYFAPEKLRRFPVQKGIIYEFVASGGSMTNYYKYIPQTMHMAMLIFMVINSVYILIKRDYDDNNAYLCISILGLALFLMFWENRSRYVLTLLPLMIIMEVNGIAVLSKLKRSNDV